VLSSDSLERRELELIGEKIVREYGKQGIQEAGLLAYDGGRANPVLMPLQFFARFQPRVTEEEVAELNKKYGVRTLRKPQETKRLYLLGIPAGREGVEAIVEVYAALPIVEFAHPNLWKQHELFDTTPFDPFFANQWHHRNTGQLAGLVDADADTSFGWDFGLGDSDVVIAVADTGANTDHEDLAINLYVNPGEIAGNGVDDDGNTYIDDVSGWDFVSGDNDPVAASSNENHATAVSGVALARANNATGVAGACPQCSWMPLRIASPFISDATFVDLFDYVATMNVDIMNNSWGHSWPWASVSAAVETAIDNAAASGVAIFFAAGNGDFSGWCGASYPSLDDSVIAVSSSTNLDKKVTEAAWGDCIDILAPSHRGYNEPYNGTANVTTTDREGSPGYNDANPPPLVCPQTEPTNKNYTHCFGGTSSASPLAAGIGGLIFSADGGLDRTEMQRLIQDTADKIVPDVADYDDDTGFSTPLTHSFGRINALEAVRLAAPTGDGGRGGVDIFVRDNRLDWGNTSGYLGQQASNVKFNSPRGFIGHWKSEDIKVDAPPYQPVPTAATFDAFVDEKPSLAPGDINRAYLRVRNRGPVTAEEVSLKLMWTQFGTALPLLNSDFWTQFPDDSLLPGNPWTSMTCAGTANPYCVIDNVPYSGASVAGTVGDPAQIAQFDFPAPTYDPGLANHFCLLAVADAANDSVDPISTGIFQPDQITPNDNNVTHRNYHDLDTSVIDEDFFRFFVRNPFDFTIRTRLTLQMDPRLAETTQVAVRELDLGEFFSLEPKAEKLLTLYVGVGDRRARGDIDIAQEYYSKAGLQNLGGFTIEVHNGEVKK
jgi:subtilisin family serine protease